MASPQSTCWTLIGAAAEGSAPEREAFAQRYAPVVQAYLAARWRGSPFLALLEDAVQDVFVDCFKENGVLQKVDRTREGGFRPFLYGVARLVALRLESARARLREQPPDSAADLQNVQAPDLSLSQVFDRAWAQMILREAVSLHAERARLSGAAAVRRVELLRLRFQDNRPIRDIAGEWAVDPAVLHHEYAKARQEFKAALLEVMAFHHPGSPAEIEQECANLASLWK